MVSFDVVGLPGVWSDAGFQPAIVSKRALCGGNNSQNSGKIPDTPFPSLFFDLKCAVAESTVCHSGHIITLIYIYIYVQ